MGNFLEEKELNNFYSVLDKVCVVPETTLFEADAVLAEAVIAEEDETLFLTCIWNGESPDYISFELSDESILPYFDYDAEIDELEAIRGRSAEIFGYTDIGMKYPKVCNSLMRMVAKQIREFGCYSAYEYRSFRSEWPKFHE